MVVMIAKSLPYVPYFVHRGQLFASSTTILSTRGKASLSVLNGGIGALYSRHHDCGFKVSCTLFFPKPWMIYLWVLMALYLPVAKLRFLF
jgi:hypothetical protein